MNDSSHILAEPVRLSLGPRGALHSGEALAGAAPDGRVVAVFDVDGELYALSGACLHKGGPIADGYVRDGCVTCPMHWWRYEIRTGRLVGDPERRLETYAVAVADGEIVVTLPPRPPQPASLRERLLALAREAVGKEPE